MRVTKLSLIANEMTIDTAIFGQIEVDEKQMPDGRFRISWTVMQSCLGPSVTKVFYLDLKDIFPSLKFPGPKNDMLNPCDP